MDSLSQIVLGAATGELVAGRKLGNRALWLGALGGTIPDLDVFGRFVLSPLENLAFHRGISHSILFWVVGAVVFGELAWRLSRRGGLDRFHWWGFWFATFATHVLLDCFTMYGTQVFQPFANTRVAWSTIAVADPLYTVPFLVAVVVLSRQTVGSRRRQWWHRAGWVWSLAYLSLTVGNKLHVDAVLQESLKDAGLPALRHVSNPTILNNVLWNATAETADAFYLTQYSIFDRTPPVWTRLDKDDDWFSAHQGDPVLGTLQWFSDGLLYKTRQPTNDGSWQLSDLRFGSLTGRADSPGDLIFRFRVQQLPSGELNFLGAEGGPKEGEETNFIPALWRRMKGR